jgi:DNA (cytosine-5)-methyltransferase 1
MWNVGGTNIGELARWDLEKMGYDSAYTLLNAVNYGAPQIRERMFLLGCRRELRVKDQFPHPTHVLRTMPVGYRVIHAVAPHSLRSPDLFEPHGYMVPPIHQEDMNPAVTAHEALGDLPSIRPLELQINGHRLPFRPSLGDLMDYREDVQPSAYARTMRDWPAFEALPGATGNATRRLPRDFAIFAEMREDDRYRQAVSIAERILQRKFEALQVSDMGQDEIQKLTKETVPPYPRDKFPDKWRKLSASRPSHTLTAHLGKDGYSHIHFDDREARTLTVREAARLQSFPDGFVFTCSMNQAFRQIGNSVPPLMAKALAIKVRDAVTVAAGNRPDLVSTSESGKRQRAA